MAKLSGEHKESIAVLIQEFNSMPDFAKRFYPPQLTVALMAHQTTTDETKSAWKIAAILIKDTGFLQRQYFSFSQSVLIKNCQESLWAQETEDCHPIFDARIDPDEAAAQKREFTAHMEQEFINLEFSDLEARAYYEDAGRHRNANSLRRGVRELYHAGLLVGESGQANYNTIFVADEFAPAAIARCLIAFNKANLLTGDHASVNRDALKNKSYAYLGDLIKALRELTDAGFFAGETPSAKAMAQANLNALFQHQKTPAAVARSIIKLTHAGILTPDEKGQEIRDIVAGHQSPHVVTDAILCLNEREPSEEQRRFMLYAQRNTATFFGSQVSRQSSDGVDNTQMLEERKPCEDVDNTQAIQEPEQSSLNC